MFNQPNSFLTAEFVIDEKPVSVYTPEVAVEDDQEPGLNLVSMRNVVSVYQRDDLVSQMAQILLDQHDLMLKTKQLEKKGAGDDEFGRFVKHLLPFLDNFQHLLDLARERPPSEELDGWLKSTESLYFRIVNLLDTYGLQFINCVGKPVDLNYQEVVEYRPSAEHKNETVIREVAKGIVFRGRLMRDAKVVVAYTPEAEGN